MQKTLAKPSLSLSKVISPIRIADAVVTAAHFMNTTGFTETQKHALMDLLVIGMYVDHNLTSAENACVVRLLDTFQFSSDCERKQFSDAAFTRASRHADSPEAIRAYVTQVAGNFPTRDLRRGVYDALSMLLTNDGRVTTEESQLLGTVREVFQL